MELQPIYFDIGLLLVTISIFCLGLIMYYRGRQLSNPWGNPQNALIKVVSPVPVKVPSERELLQTQIISFQAYLSGVDDLLACVDDPEYRSKLRFEKLNTEDFLDTLENQLKTLPFTTRSKGTPKQ
tara:strand:- start:190 stop:567 length:378 start_codon:yes stop_codon:yes gene_type:complete